MTNLSLLAAKNLGDIIRDAICLQANENTLVIYDTEAHLTQIVLDGYREAIPQGEFLDFASVTPEQIMERISACKAGDLVVILQSTNFRLNEFRLRIELFQRGLKTIEHVHLKRIHEDEFERYIQSLAYDKQMYRPLGTALKNILERANE